MTKTPCYLCKDRELGCHAICQKYIDWQDIHKEEAKAVHEDARKRIVYKSDFIGVCPPPTQHRKTRSTRT